MGGIFFVLAAIPLLVPFMAPLMLIQLIVERFRIQPPEILQPWIFGASVTVEIAWLIGIVYFWHWMKWSWWIPAIWIGALVALVLMARFS